MSDQMLDRVPPVGKRAAPAHSLRLWLPLVMDQLHDKFPGVAIVLATADTTVPPVVSMQSGVVDYVVKPFVRERVLDAVARAVEWAQHAPAERSRRPGDDPLNEWLNKGRK